MGDPSVAAHAAGEHGVALSLRQQLLAEVGVSDPRYPGFLAAAALNNERLGDHGAAVTWANEALHTPAPFGELPAAAALRDEQLPSVHINAGTVLLRDAARRRWTETPVSRQLGVRRQRHADDLFALAWQGVQRQRTERWRPHQHHINLAPRRAMSEAVNGRPRDAFGFALGALALAPLSESPLLVEHTSGLGWKGRLFAKAKSIGRGVNALFVAATALPKVRDSERAQRFRDRRIAARRFGA